MAEGKSSLARLLSDHLCAHRDRSLTLNLADIGSIPETRGGHVAPGTGEALPHQPGAVASPVPPLQTLPRLPPMVSGRIPMDDLLREAATQMLPVTIRRELFPSASHPNLAVWHSASPQERAAGRKCANSRPHTTSDLITPRSCDQSDVPAVAAIKPADGCMILSRASLDPLPPSQSTASFRRGTIRHGIRCSGSHVLPTLKLEAMAFRELKAADVGGIRARTQVTPLGEHAFQPSKHMKAKQGGVANPQTCRAAEGRRAARLALRELRKLAPSGSMDHCSVCEEVVGCDPPLHSVHVMLCCRHLAHVECWRAATKATATTGDRERCPLCADATPAPGSVARLGAEWAGPHAFAVNKKPGPSAANKAGGYYARRVSQT